MGLRTVEQLRGARAMLNWTQSKLAGEAGVSTPTIKRLESGQGGLAIRLETLSMLEGAFERAGVEFIEENGGGAGVRYEKPAGE